jgi:hypothetical protein
VVNPTPTGSVCSGSCIADGFLLLNEEEVRRPGMIGVLAVVVMNVRVSRKISEKRKLKKERRVWNG